MVNNDIIDLTTSSKLIRYKVCIIIFLKIQEIKIIIKYINIYLFKK